jgi:hypothetical protein
LFGQRRFQLGQRGAGAHRDHQLTRLVAADAAQRAHVERIAACGFTVEGLAATAPDVQRALVGAGSTLTTANMSWATVKTATTISATVLLAFKALPIL